MVNLISTNDSSDVSAEYAEQVDERLRGMVADRETTSVDRDGQTGLSIRLYAYDAPGITENRWAVDYNDPASRELEEYATEAEAEARYEEMVRDAARNLSVDRDGIEERFTTTDVDGVPGPLPDLPTVDADDVATLLDEVSEEPVMYVERTEGDEIELSYGPAAYTSSESVVLTRQQVLEALLLSDDEDGAGRVTSKSLTSEDTGTLLQIADEAQADVRRAASGLFPVDEIA
ncbi:hypothetical protein AB0D00_26570 [Streptomyces sp. NPDC048213]|uniref:hypothetical protein n=1 Tax=Streptomyces sp. NPDC048213 TaxID=3160984 RepID=UPI0033C60B86